MAIPFRRLAEHIGEVAKRGNRRSNRGHTVNRTHLVDDRFIGLADWVVVYEVHDPVHPETASARVGEFLITDLDRRVPQPVTDLSAVGGPRIVTLSWDDPEDTSITGYEISVDSDQWTLATTTSIIDPSTGEMLVSHEATGLTDDVEYQFGIRAVNANGPSAAVYIQATPTAGAPEPPENLAAVRYDNRLAVSWSPNTMGGTPLYYQLRYREGLDAWIDIDQITTTGYDIENLRPDTAYSIEVRAVNDAQPGTSDWAQLMLRRTYPSMVPGQMAPVMLTLPTTSTILAGLPNATTILVDWAEPTNFGPPILSYQLRYRVLYDEWTEIHNLQGLQKRITGLNVASLIYEVQARAVNDVGPSEWSLGKTSTGMIAASPPDAPQLTDVLPVSGPDLEVQWDAPTDDGGSRVLEYQIVYNTEGIPPQYVSGISTVAPLTTLLTGLEPNTEYTVRIRALSAVGVSGYSDPITVRTGPATVPDTPDRPDAQIINVNDIEITWEPPYDNGSDIISYDIQWLSNFPSTPMHMVEGQLPYDRVYRILFVLPYTYKIRIRAINAIGASGWSPYAEVSLGAPGPPLNFRASVERPPRAILNWDPPTDPGDSAITHYEYVSSTNPDTWITVSDGDEVTLAQNATVTLAVRAVNSSVNGPRPGPPSESVTVFTGALSGVPDTPAAPRGETLSSSRLRALWDAPNDRGNIILGYTVRYRVLGGAAWTEVRT